MERSLLACQPSLGLHFGGPPPPRFHLSAFFMRIQNMRKSKKVFYIFIFFLDARNVGGLVFFFLDLITRVSLFQLTAKRRRRNEVVFPSIYMKLFVWRAGVNLDGLLYQEEFFKANWNLSSPFFISIVFFFSSFFFEFERLGMMNCCVWCDASTCCGWMDGGVTLFVRLLTHFERHDMRCM
ncbi:hypothetical protein J3F83DRAFT_351804 [Trichoderma novae-zelandiae]